MVNLHAYVACRTFALVLCDCGVLGACKDVARVDSDVDWGNLCQGIHSCLEVGFLALEDHVDVGSKWHVAECRNKNRLRRVVGVGNDSVRTLDDEAEHAAFEQCLLHLFCTERIDLLLAEVYVLLCGRRFDLNA